MDSDRAPDDDRTVMPERPSVPKSAVPHEEAPVRIHTALPSGTRLAQEFEILEVVGEGGFSIVYLALEPSLDRRVAIKEYMPSTLAARRGDMTVAAKSERYADTFEAGRRSFINEARLLARFDHPSLLKVYRYWEANGTAYMAMPFYQATTFKQLLADAAGPPDEQWLKRFLAQLLDAIEVLHRADCLHRDISPDNILVLPEDQPLLLDFGAARHVIGDMNQALTVIVKPGYAPIEQYGEGPAMKQGPWTDLYALAGVVYFAISGKAPTPCIARMSVDPLAPLAGLAGGRYSAPFLRGIDRALSVNPADRPQSVGEFRTLLNLDGASSTRRYETGTAPVAKRDERPRRRDGADGDNRSYWRVILALSGVVALALMGGGVTYFLLSDRTANQIASRPPAPAGPVQIPVPPSAPPAATDSQSERIATAPLPNSSEAISPRPPGVAEGQPSIAQSPQAVPKPTALDPLQILQQIYDGRDPQHVVEVTVVNPRVSIKGREALRWRVTSSRPGYIYVLYVGTGRDFLLMFPNAADSQNFLAASQTMTLPRSAWDVQAEGPAGTDHFVAIVSDSARDFSALPRRKLQMFAQFLLDPASRNPDEGARGSPYAGRVKCPASTGECPDSYGAARFDIEEVGG